MVTPRPPRRPYDNLVRLPRAAELRRRVIDVPEKRSSRQSFNPTFILLYGFVGLILLGSLLLWLPLSDASGRFTSPIVALFTATSAVTVTGHTTVSTAQHWSHFGHAVIFVLMLVGGLGFMAAATFALLLAGRGASISRQLILKETIGDDRLGSLRRIALTIVIVVFAIYIFGAAFFFPTIRSITGLGLWESLWQSLFLSVSSFNNAGFSILPEISDTRSLAILDNQWLLQGCMATLIILGSIGWTVLVDIGQRRRFSQFSLDTKLVVIGSLVLWALGFAVYFLAGFARIWGEQEVPTLQQAWDALFHSISGRTAGFMIADFGAAEDFTKLAFTFLMFVGGASGSVAGGIKVNTLMVVAVAVISSIRARAQAEAFGREIPQNQVFRALAIGVLALGSIVLIVPVLTITEAAALRSGELEFLDLFFDAVSAFATNGSSTGIVPQLGTASQLIFVLMMLVGRIGPLTLALTLAQEDRYVYNFAREQVKIG